MPGPNGCGNVTTTVRASGVVTTSGSPSICRLLASTLFTAGSKTAEKVNATSADVNGAPSDHWRPSRRVRVCTSPSGDVVHDSASQGSTSCVARLTRTSLPCVSSETSSTAKSRETRRLNDRGSERTEAVSVPPRAGRSTGGAAGAGPRLETFHQR